MLWAAEPRPALGRAAREPRCTDARPSSTSARPPPTPGWPRTRPASASSSATPGRPGTTASTRARRHARPPATSSCPTARRRRPPGRRTGASRGQPALVRARALSRRDRARGAALGRLRGAARGAADGRVELQPVRGLSPAGAAGIAQFMPATAAAYGLGDPFDAEAAIDAQAHLMSDLLAQFGEPRAGARRLQRRSRPGRGLRLRPRLSRDPGLRRPHPRARRRRRLERRRRPAGARGAAGGLRSWTGLSAER